jgi:TolA-binding protein
MLWMPAEVASADKQARKRYLDAIRDWVEKGDASIYALSPEEIRRHVHGRMDHEVLAEANFRLGQYLYQQGNRQAAQQYFNQAP